MATAELKFDFPADILYKCVKQKYSRIVTSFDPEREILNKLFEKGIITISEKVRIQNLSEEKRGEALVDKLLSCREPCAIAEFLEILFASQERPHRNIAVEVHKAAKEMVASTLTSDGSERSSILESQDRFYALPSKPKMDASTLTPSYGRERPDNDTDNGIYTDIRDQLDGVPTSDTSEVTEAQDVLFEIRSTTTTKIICKAGNQEMSGQLVELAVKQAYNQHDTQRSKKLELPVKSTESADLTMPVQVAESCSNMDVIYPFHSGNFDEGDSNDVISERYTSTRDLVPVNNVPKINFPYADHPEHPVKIMLNPSSDGNCQFDAVCNRLGSLTPSVTISPSDLREQVVDYMRKNPGLSNWIEKTDSASWSTYLEKMSQSGTHGNHLTLVAVAKIYTVQIIVLSTAGIKYTSLITPNQEQITRDLPFIVLGYYPENDTYSGHYVSLEIENWSWEFVEKIVADSRRVACRGPRESLVTEKKEISQQDEYDNVDSRAALADMKWSKVDSTTILDFVESTNIFRIDKAEMEKYLDKPLEKIGKGSYGTVYSGSFQDIRVAIKIQTEKDLFSNEKSLASLRNPYIVPVLGFSDDDSEKLLLMFPRMSMNLADALNLNDAQKEPKFILSREDKIRIMYQIIEGLNFLHTPKIFVRGPIIHGDVRPENILLDGLKNARLADAGLAVVIPEKHTHRSTADMSGALGYVDPYKLKGDGRNKCFRRVSNDLFSFGIVALQILKQQRSYVTVRDDDDDCETVKTLWQHIKDTFKKIPNARAYCENPEFFNKKDWSNNDDDDDDDDDDDSDGDDDIDIEIIEKITNIALSCIDNIPGRKATNIIAGKLKGILESLQFPLFVCQSDNKNGKCINCFIDNAIVHGNLDKRCCRIPLFCHSCLNSPLNRPYCPLDGRYLFDSENSCTFLISGQDNDSAAQDCFKSDVNKMYNVIKKFAYTGMKERNIHEFHLSENSNEQINKILNKLSEYKEKEPELLIFYYSGHADKKDKHLLSSEKCGYGITPDVLREHFKQIMSKRLLVILDCCNAGHFKVLPENCDNYPKWEIQMNSANPKGTADIEPTDDNSISSSNTTYKSTFTKCFIAALEGNRDCPMSKVDCKHCIKYRDLVFVNECKSINHVFDYIREHMKMDDPRYTPNMYSYVHSDTKIAH